MMNKIVFGLFFTIAINSALADVGRSQVPVFSGVAAESLCGPTATYQDVERYDGALGPTVNFVSHHQSRVGQIQWNNNLASVFSNPGNVNDHRWCSGTLIADNLFLTAGHCFDPQLNDGSGWDFPVAANGVLIDASAAAMNMHVNFGYQFNSVGVLREPERVAITALREYRNNGLDYAIVELAGNPGARYGVATLSQNIPALDSLLTIIQHPNGRPKVIEAGRYSGQNASGYARYINLDTEGGSSGSGILAENGTLVGVHTNAGCSANGTGSNHGILINSIVSFSPIVDGIIFQPSMEFEVSSRKVIEGETITRTWASRNTDYCLSKTGQRLATSGAWVTGPLTASNEFEISCHGSRGAVKKSIYVEVIPKPKMTFDVSPRKVIEGQTVTRIWSSTNADYCLSKTGMRLATSGVWETTPLSASNDFEISCYGPGGAVKQSIYVEVVPTPTMSFSVSPTVVKAGEAVVRTWTSQNTDYCLSKTGVRLGTSGVWPTSPLGASNLFEISCYGAGGSVTKSQYVTVLN